jgi:hypothetical protein
MGANYNYYKIDIVDIWQYEQDQFLDGSTSEELARSIIDSAEDLIIRRGMASFKVDLGVNISERDRSYYFRNLNAYKRASKTLIGRYKINYFFKKDSCYQFDQQIIINQENPDFDFWFALKLGQYDSKLIEIKNFLVYQLEEAFNKDLVRFIDFLKLEMKQYLDTIFDDRITETIDSWIKEKNSLNRKIRGRYVTLKLKELASSPNYFLKNKNTFNGVFNRLIENEFIHKDTLFTDFKRIFEDGLVHESKRIIWTGTNKDLHWFMNYLVKDSKKVELHRNDIWVVANKCFVDENRMEFGTDPLRWAKGNDIKRKNLLESILAKI